MKIKENKHMENINRKGIDKHNSYTFSPFRRIIQSIVRCDQMVSNQIDIPELCLPGPVAVEHAWIRFPLT